MTDNQNVTFLHETLQPIKLNLIHQWLKIKPTEQCKLETKKKPPYSQELSDFNKFIIAPRP
jgi:hypothetical protein